MTKRATISWPVAEPERTGSVDTFDDDRGTGTVVDGGGDRFAFHCTAILDGSRSVAVGTPVSFTLAPGHGGRVEALALRPLAPRRQPTVGASSADTQ